MTDLLNDTSTALYTTLQAGTALTALLAGTVSIYESIAPDESSYPLVIFQHQGGGPDNINHSVIESNLWLVKAYSTGSAKEASDVFAQVDVLLHKRAITIGTSNTFWLCREENVKLLETLPNKKHAWMRGGIYRIRTSG